MLDIRIGDRVYINKGGDKRDYAIVLWLGYLPPKHVGNNVGFMVGIQFDDPVGKGNGSLGNVQYFTARNGHAAFVPAKMLKKANEASSSILPDSSRSPAKPASSDINSRAEYRHNATNDLSSVFDSTSSTSYYGANGGFKSPIRNKPAQAPIGTRPTASPSAYPNSSPASSPSSSLSANVPLYHMFGGTRDLPTARELAHGASSNLIGSPYRLDGSRFRGDSDGTEDDDNNSDEVGRGFVQGGLDADDDEEEVFESDDDLDEVLKGSSGNAAPQISASLSQLSTRDVKTNVISTNNNSKLTPNNMPKPNGELPTTPWNSAVTSVTPRSVSPPEAPTASTEWSVVVSKIKKAPKQVRDQLKPPEKKPVLHVKPKTKMEKILEENPKFKSTLCSWYVQGARCPNGNECHFAHGESELRSVPRPKYKYKTQVCTYYAAGHCGNGSACHYAHGAADLHKHA